MLKLHVGFSLLHLLLLTDAARILPPALLAQGQRVNSRDFAVDPIQAQVSSYLERTQFQNTTNAKQITSVITVQGFERDMNGMYTMHREESLQVGHHDTYWSLGGLYFIYRCPTSQIWSIGKRFDLREARAGNCNAVAYHPATNDKKSSLVPFGPIFEQGWHEYAGGEWVAARYAKVVQVNNACSSYSEDQGSCTAHDCQWQAPGAAEAVCTAPWSFFGPRGPQFSDIAQGDLGTCYFLAALAAVSHNHPQIIQDMFYKKYSGASFRHAVFATKWYVMGQMIKVDVDDQIPVSAAGRPSFASYSLGRNFWPLVFEKAWAKIYRNYQSIHFGLPAEAFAAITRAPIITYRHRTLETDSRLLWANLEKARKKKHPIIGNTSPNPSTGIMGSHAWAVLDTSKVKIGRKFVNVVLIYNTILTVGYSGQVPTSINAPLAVGHFYMTIEEYYADFDLTTVAEVEQGYDVTSQVVAKDSSHVSADIEFSITKDLPFAIQLAWPSARVVNKAGCVTLRPAVSMEVFKNGVSSKRVRRAGGLRGAHYTAQLTSHIYSGAGSYRVSVSAEFQNGPWLRDIVVNTYAHASEVVQFRQAGQEKRAVLLVGFHRSSFNKWFIERPDMKAGGQATFWTGSRDYFLYWCKEDSVWALTTKKFWTQASDEGAAQVCANFAHAPAGKNSDIFREGSLVKHWSEWYGKRWVHHERAGVGSKNMVARNSSSLMQTPASNGHAPSTCTSLMHRMESLHNWRDIKEQAEDPLFPASQSSIADPGKPCDFVGGVAESCASYDRWRSLPAIASDEPPPTNP